ncbi:MAG TPA: hypothetical protein VGX23_36135 [Actinocrinis sp.]|nr:hypothetical protein [Actinocrinis sp.]
MEGHFILGYGDGTGGARADIELFDQARLEAEALVSDDSEFAAAWARVERIVSGYSYPEGVELLASVHLLVTRATEPWDAKEIAEKIAAWTPRKRELFNLDDVSAALDHLASAEII